MTTKIDDDIKAPLLVFKEGADGIGSPIAFAVYTNFRLLRRCVHNLHSNGSPV